ncbi:MAG: flagellar hook-basal body protein [Candidatus Anammoxibacter sp.]
MIVGLYTSATGKAVMGKNLEVIARNLANVNTTGFKRNVAVFRTFMSDNPLAAGASVTGVKVIHEQGNLKATGNKLDIAIHGNGYFVLDSGKGIKYSRNGHFLLNSNMEVVNSVGWKLMGDGGVIELPKNTNDILINSKGEVFANNRSVGKIDIVDFKNKDVLKEAGNSSFKADRNSQPLEAVDFDVQQGFLESSNVSVIDEMVSMMANTRSFQGNDNVGKTIDRTLDKLIRTAYTTI